MICTGPFVTRGALSHRTVEFEEKLTLLRERILDYIGMGWELAVIPCSGTGAIETMLRSLKGESATGLEYNGVYASKMQSIGYTLDWELFSSPYDKLHEIDSDLDWIFMVHGETSTGELNPLDSVLQRAKETDTYVAIDAVSSFVFNKIPFMHENLGAVAFSSNKGLRGMPGIGFVAYRPKCVNYWSQNDYYFDLSGWSTNKTLFTPMTQTILDLANKLENKKYISNWNKKYNLQGHRLQTDLKKLGFMSVLENNEVHMNCLEVFYLDCRRRKNHLIEYMRKHNIEIYSNSKEPILKVSIMNLFDDDGNDKNYKYFMETLKKWKDKYD